MTLHEAKYRLRLARHNYFRATSATQAEHFRSLRRHYFKVMCAIRAKRPDVVVALVETRRVWA